MEAHDFAAKQRYLVVDLSGGADAERHPFHWTDDEPDLSAGVCRTSELWLRHIPAGTFMMGSPEDELGHRSDEVLHRVTLTRDYLMGIFPVTQRQWELVTGNNPSWHWRPGMRNKPSGSGNIGPGAPVECVSYDDICGRDRPWPANGDVAADSFLGRLRAKTGLAGFDLPTEAQWEYACRAGSTTALNNGKNLTCTHGLCPNLDEVGWFDKNSGSTTCAVGVKRPNAWGLYDMHGNVWEWCRDFYDKPYGGDATDPAGPVSGSERVCRGGSWYYDARGCRSASRINYYPGGRSLNLGFRLALVPVQ